MSTGPSPDARVTPASTEATGIPNEIDGVNTDGRLAYEWTSRYAPQAVRHIRIDAAYIAVMLFLALAAILVTWRGALYEMVGSQCASCDGRVFGKYSLYFLGGLLGGILFGIKYLYKVVARGWWHLDRRLWRLFSPWLSGSLALVVGALLESGVLGLTMKVNSGAAYLSYGFITGYFADRAIDKMHDVAETLFGAPGRKDPSKG